MTWFEIHMLCVLLSISGFAIRGVWMLQNCRLLQHTVTKIVPHVIDTLLIVSGVMLIIQTSTYPWEHVWLGFKVTMLIVYIVLSVIALRSGKTKQVRLTAFVAALAVFALMIFTAFTQEAPWQWIGL